ncbi:hypothetical protein [Microvirga terricola]|uniref:DUF2946 domain-containing protein n=1 Tax=Microvirga terricola TaxID=2719797 RepID=A0ABX0VG52_9HYPH|nr:hypothetical protein [Microvirga terricola]NIX78261.1 hypothetical protein [Microvirga terricola]
MRRFGTMIAILLALTMAVFPVRGVSAAVAMSLQKETVAAAAHHHDHASYDRDGQGEASVTRDVGSPSRHTPHHAAPATCCDMICHAITTTMAVVVGRLTPFARLRAILSDEQVESHLSARHERPPRTA